MQHPKKTIDARLRAAADLALEAIETLRSPFVADVGCDHGYLTAYLLRQRDDLRMVASDISKASLAKARMLLDPGLYGRRVRFEEADGLDALHEGENPDCIVMAGMGGRLILEVLTKGREKIGSAKLVLQANVDIPLLRQELAKMGIDIIKERYAEANGRQYAVLLAQAVSDRPIDLADKDTAIGRSGDGPLSAERKDYLRTQREMNLRKMCLAARKGTAGGLEKMRKYQQEADWMAEETEMKECSVQALTEMVGQIAPYELAEEWDNVGLLVGDAKKHIKKVLVALDLTLPVLEEARMLGCEAIVTHHPLMLQPVQRIVSESREGALILKLAQYGMAHIAAHTNLDKAPGGVNDALLQTIGCKEVRGEGAVRVGMLPGEMSVERVTQMADEALHSRTRAYGDKTKQVHVLGCCSGAGSGEFREAMALGADCFITGEVKHHIALDAMFADCPMIEAGHYETEVPVCSVLQGALQKLADTLEYNLTVFCSNINPFERGEG